MNKKTGGGTAAPNKTKIICIILAVVIFISAAVGITLWQTVFKNELPTETIKLPEEQQPDEENPDEDGKPVIPTETTEDVEDENGDELISGEEYELPKQLLFSTPSAQSETASKGVTLTAKVLPEGNPSQAVDWAAEWVNASSEWANGKTVSDYVTVTPLGDGSTTATVACLDGFSEQIIITVTSREYPDISATTTVDFYEQVTDISLEVFSGETQDSFACTLGKNDDSFPVELEEVDSIMLGSKWKCHGLLYGRFKTVITGTVENPNLKFSLGNENYTVGDIVCVRLSFTEGYKNYLLGTGLFSEEDVERKAYFTNERVSVNKIFKTSALEYREDPPLGFDPLSGNPFNVMIGEKANSSSISEEMVEALFGYEGVAIQFTFQAGRRVDPENLLPNEIVYEKTISVKFERAAEV